MYQDGKWIKEDQTQARTYYEKACELRDAESCVLAGWFYSDGTQVRKSLDKAMSFYEKGKRLGSPEAYGAIAWAITQWKIESRYAEVIPLFEQGCQAGNKFNCETLGEIYETGDTVPVDKAKSQAYYKKSCDLGFAEACKNSFK